MGLPVIDVRALADPADSFAHRRTVRALRESCHDPGFCYIVGHGIPARLDAAALAAARAFFALPREERHRIAIGQSPHFRGYTILGDERTGGLADWRDQIDIGPEEPRLVIDPNAPRYETLRGPNQWPASLPSFRFATLEWMRSMSALGRRIMAGLAVGLGQPCDFFEPLLSPNPYPRLKVIRYPATDRGAHPSDQKTHGHSQGVGWHNDSGLLSFILQDDVGGLEVDTREGVVAATPRDGAYVMNLGEMLQRATQGYLSATRHRVVSPPPGKQRVSLAFFFNPRLDAVFHPIPLPPALAAKARGGDNPDPDDPVHATFGDNTLKIRMRAHPDVTERFYQGLA